MDSIARKKKQVITGKKPVPKNRSGSKGKSSRDSARKNVEYIDRAGTYLISKLRPIGNSRGVILNSRLIEAAGLNAESDLMIVAGDGVITIQMKPPGVNTDLSSWDKQFKAAVKKGASPEGDLFAGVANDFDLNEW